MCVAIVVGSGPALAQEATLPTLNVESAADGGIGPDTGYVALNTTTGAKTDTPLELIPQSVSIVTEQEISDRRPESIEQAIGYVPGVVPSPWGADNRFENFLIRGFDVGSYGMFRDGLPQKIVGWAGFKIEPYGAQRIEVLRGPNAVLYGESDPGGIVNVVTKRPVFEPLREGYIAYGPFNSPEAGIDIGGPLGNAGTLAYRLTGVWRNGETSLTDSVDDRSFIAPALTFQNDSTSLTILANWQDDKSTPSVFLPVAGDEYPAEFGPLPDWFKDSVSPFNQYHARLGSIGYLFEHELEAPVVLRQNLRYSQQDTDYTELYVTGMASDTEMEFAPFGVDQTAKAFVVDNMLEWQFGLGTTRHTLLVGADYNWTEADGTESGADSILISVLDPNYDTPIGPLVPYADGTLTTEQFGLYLQDQVQLTERFFTTFGLRQSWVDTSYDDRLEGNADTEEDYNHLSWNLGLVYQLPNGLAPYASYSTGFVSNSGRTFEGTLFEPTEAEQVEIGAKYTPAGFDGFFTAALFDITKTNLLTADPAHPDYSIQTGEVRHRGLELEANLSLGNGLSAVAGYTYIDAEITSSNDGDEGNRSALVPENQASIWANYDVLGGRFQGVSFGAGVRYVGESFGDTSNDRVTPSYTIADAALRYARGNLEGAINISNLFDEDYYATCYAGGGCTTGDPREITGTLTVRF